jgi:hypothetical protein
MKYPFEELDIYFTDFAVPLKWQGQTLNCLFSEKSDPLAFQAGGRDINAVVKTREVTGIASGQAVEIDGRNFSITEINPIQDGQIIKLQLEEA